MQDNDNSKRPQNSIREATEQDVASLPSVSLLLPVRNESGFIERLLNDLLQQNYPGEKLEILLADGMSDDGTREILTEFAARCPRVRWIDNPARIVPSGLNAMIRIANGDVLMRLDGHTSVPQNYVMASVNLLQTVTDAWGVGGPIVHAGRSRFGSAAAAAMSHPAGVGNATHRFPDFEGYGEGSAFWTFHRCVFDRVGLFDEALIRTEDDEFNYRVKQAGGRIYLSPKIQSIYFVRENPCQLAKQYFQYSFWRIPVMKKHRRPTTFRQIVPLVFFMVMFLLAVAGTLMGNAWVALTLPVVYSSILILLGISMVPKLGLRTALLVPAAMFIMHASYAAGMLYGLFASAVHPSAWNRHGKMSQLSR